MVDVLAEHGHLDLLRCEAEAGDYPCADAAARLMRARGEPAETALALLRPFVDTDWVAPAVDHIAEILAERGDLDAAIDLLRPLAGEGHPESVVRLAALYARQGRPDDVLAMLRLPPDRLFPIDVAVEATRGLGRDDEVIEILRSHLDSGWGVAGLVASVLERAGRAAEAIAALTGYLLREGSYNVDDAEQLADLLARHDPAALVDLATGRLRRYVAPRLARLYEEQGRDDDAAALLAALAGEHRRRQERLRQRHPAKRWLTPLPGESLSDNEMWLYADFLVRHGRSEEAITVLRPAAPDDPDLVRPLCVLLIGQGRPDEARAVAAGAADGWPDPVRVRLEWVEALVACGRHERAVAELRADPGARSGYARGRLAEALAAAGSPDEAIAMLGEATAEWHLQAIANALIRAGRPEAAITALRTGPSSVV